MMLRDALTYLPDDILVKVDRASMGVSLETRVPFLDHRVAEFCWSLPLSMKIKDGQGKWLLRQVLNRHVPQELVERPKTGFAVPIADWLRGPLERLGGGSPRSGRAPREGFLNADQVGPVWAGHSRGGNNARPSLVRTHVRELVGGAERTLIA